MIERNKRKYVRYLLIDVFIVFNGRPLGVVTGGRRGRRKPAEKTAGVLLLPVYKLLHEALPVSHARTQSKWIAQCIPQNY